MMSRTGNENAASLRRICKRSDQPKIERLVNNDARLILRESLTGQRHDRVQTESQIATVDSCFDLVGSRQHGVASYEIFSWSADIHILTKMVMTSDETQIQIFANWPMSHAQGKNRKSLEYRVVAAIRKLRTDTNCPAGKS